MKLKEYLENINKLIRKNPKLLEMEVVYSKDDEGNGFGAVHYEPSIGHYDSDEREFYSEDAVKEDPTEQFKTLKHVPIKADPILFYLDGSAEGSTSRERSIQVEDKLINIHYWGNDFSFLRKFNWLISTYRWRDSDISNLSRSLLSLIPFLFILIPTLLMTNTVSTGMSIVACLASACILYFNLTYKRNYLNDLWNSEKI